MKIKINSTEEIFNIPSSNNSTRIWTGTTEKRIPIEVYIFSIVQIK